MCTKYFIWRKEKLFTVRFSHSLSLSSGWHSSTSLLDSLRLFPYFHERIASRESIVSFVNGDHGKIRSRGWLSAHGRGVRRTNSGLCRSDLLLWASIASDSAAHECLEVHRSMATRTIRTTGPTHSIRRSTNSQCFRSISRYSHSFLTKLIVPSFQVFNNNTNVLIESSAPNLSYPGSHRARRRRRPESNPQDLLRSAQSQQTMTQVMRRCFPVPRRVEWMHWTIIRTLGNHRGIFRSIDFEVHLCRRMPRDRIYSI